VETNILIVGVGGQGVITVGRLISLAGIMASHNVVMSELHGLAQRGGSVSVNVRLGNIISPIPEAGSVNCVIALEPMEGLRYSPRVGKDAVFLVNLHPMTPISLSMQEKEYPPLSSILNEIKRDHQVIPVDATEIAHKVGNVRVSNSVLAGALAAAEIVNVSRDDFIVAITKMFSSNTKDQNIKAFDSGYNYTMQYMEKNHMLLD
jgi:indolepyruvate ferredoxin oxidoreductase beta subunit